MNPTLVGQRFPKRGTHNNFSRNKDALFILIDRYLLLFFFYEHWKNNWLSIIRFGIYVSTLNKCI